LIEGSMNRSCRWFIRTYFNFHWF